MNHAAVPEAVYKVFVAAAVHMVCQTPLLWCSPSGCLVPGRSTQQQRPECSCWAPFAGSFHCLMAKSC